MDTLCGKEYFSNQENFGDSVANQLQESYDVVNQYNIACNSAGTQEGKTFALAMFTQKTLTAMGVAPEIVRVSVYSDENSVNAKYSS